MSSHVKPWTFEPFVVDQDTTWTIYDENQARIVAVFHFEDEAMDYLAWRNKKQAKKKAKKQAEKQVLCRWVNPEDNLPPREAP